ncbi:transaldolase [Roseiarcus fermentans]|uniref:Transaldolase n=1 Tax=Roseiarcus fermentans TaxID=1473586 RepID=A0A366ETM2_9HYPH|nr:transaldolase family protein [Roseiarcus fermentans]RBP05753.1 transaldolase [Roseiarcus fermentans]
MTISPPNPSPLYRTVHAGPTDVWNDSCSPRELEYAIGNGAVGATTNPSIVLAVLKKEFAAWKDRLLQLIHDNPAASEDEIAWKLIELMGLRGAEMLLPVFERERRRKGRLSMQTNPVNYRNVPALVEQAVHFAGLAPNIQVKIPATAAGIAAIEEATRLGVDINATVSFTLPQAIAVAEAVERGLDRRAAEGHDVSGMTPVCTLMIGRLDDWLKVVATREGVVTTPGHLDWAGVATFKKAYGLFKARGYRTRLLAAAYRHHLHWSQLIGGDVVLTIPYEWQVQFNKSDVEVKKRIDDPVDPAIVADLYRKFPDFRRAYDEGGLSIEEFDRYGATARTLRSFIEAYRELTALVRDSMLPAP